MQSEQTEQAPFWSSFLSPWATLTRSETVSDKKIFTLVYVGPINFLSWVKKWFWWVWVKSMWLLSWVDGARTILVQFPVTLSDSDTLRDCFGQEKFFTSVDVGLRKCKCKCPPSVSQVPADGGLPTLESFLPILWVDFFSHVFLLSCCNAVVTSKF